MNEYAGWTMSEKFDGVNATWDGRSLTSRDGNRFDAPDWFVAGLPACRLVGELWVERGGFEQVCSVVLSSNAGERWRKVRYLVFRGRAGENLGEFAEYVEWRPCLSGQDVDGFYAGVLAVGGEGIMLRDDAGNYIKRKPVSDDDARLIGYCDGKGRNAGRVGALLLRDAAGREFRLGVGLSDSDRDNPPPVGAIIKFTFQGRTARGIPRFACYLGRRAEACFV